MFDGGNNIFADGDFAAYVDEGDPEEAAPEVVHLGAAAAKGKGKGVRGKKGIRQWQIYADGLTKDELEKVMKDLGIKNFGHVPWLKRSDSAWLYNKTDDKYRRVAWCGFRHDCDCDWRVEETCEIDDVTNKRMYSVCIDETLSHADHTQSRQSSGVPKIVQSVLSPNTLSKGIHGCVERLKNEGFSWFLGEEGQLKLASFRARFNSKRRHAKLSSDDTSKKNSFGRLSTYVSSREKQVLQEKGLFNEHAAYVLDGWEVDQTTGNVRIAFCVSFVTSIPAIPHHAPLFSSGAGANRPADREPCAERVPPASGG